VAVVVDMVDQVLEIHQYQMVDLEGLVVAAVLIIQVLV
jgi:hypothetical protein